MTRGALVRLGLFAAALAAVAAAAALVGRASGIEADATPAEAEAGMGHADAPAEPHESEPAGLALEQDGYRLAVEREALTAGRAERFVFRILDREGADVRDFDVEHERRLHLIVVARAPHTHFLHLHPQQRADGAWTAPVRLPANGSYRVFADFTTGGERRTLGTDLVGRGGPSTAREAVTSDDVTLDARGERLEFFVRDDDGPGELQPYLGALGHLVVVREGDFAYVHAHAEEDELAFDVPFPTPGRYRLYLQYQVDGRVETVRFTRTVT